MPCIPDAFTDCTPTAADFHGRLYVAFKRRRSNEIRVVSTDNPEGALDRWEYEVLPSPLRGDGPGEIRSSVEPALAVAHNKLWITFKDPDSPALWTCAMEDHGTWIGDAKPVNAQSSSAPAAEHSMVVHRGIGNDSQIRYTYHSVEPLPEDEEIPGAMSDTSPAVAFWSPDARIARRIVAFKDRSEIKVTMTAGWGWTTPEPVAGADTDRRPALEMHRDRMYLAYKRRDSTRVWLGTYNDLSWILHGVLAGISTSSGPALASHNNQTLYVVYRQEGTDEVCYGPIPPPSLDALTIMTLNVRIHPKDPWVLGIGDTSPHHWRQRVNRIVSMLQRYEAGQGPHILGMQELRLNQYRDLQELLPWYEDAGLVLRGGWYQPLEGVSIFYRPDRLEVLDSGVSRVTERERKGAGGCPRRHRHNDLYPTERYRCPAQLKITWSRFRDLHTDRTFYVYNVHFPGNTCQKLGAARIMRDLVSARAHASDPVVALGDFNIGYAADDLEENWQHHEVLDEAYRELEGMSGGLVNAYMTIRDPHRYPYFCSGNRNYGNRRRGRFIDHVLVSPSFQIYDADIDRTMFNQAGDAATVPCRAVDDDGYCLNVGDFADYSAMYSDHWAVWASLVWFPE